MPNVQHFSENYGQVTIVVGVIYGLSASVLMILAIIAYYFVKGDNQNQDIHEEERLK